MSNSNDSEIFTGELKQAIEEFNHQLSGIVTID
jgi:hypothetical protein